jgi:uncharacterized protein
MLKPRGSALKVDLEALRAERGATLVIECHEPVASGVPDIPFDEPATGTLTLTNVGAALRVDGRVHTTVTLTCGLCATSFAHRLRADIEEDLAWTSALGPGRAGEPGEHYLVRTGDSVLLDVEALVRDALVLALPMVARCSTECRGLCPGCGADLRVEPCRCASESDVIDPRLARLAAWRGRRSESGAAS